VAIYEITKTEILPLEATNFAREGVQERYDLQRLLRTNIEIVAPGTVIIAEEFSHWDDSKRRIDLLGVERAGSLVVIELKRTDDGGHMELQAIRYAAMVSNMTFSQAAAIYSEYLIACGRAEDAEAALQSHIGDAAVFGQDVRIILVSADFSKEVTTSVLWLNQREVDITCVRLRPYRLEDRVLLDVQQVIPLPEASDYTVQVRQKAEEIRARKKWEMDFSKYDLTAGDQVRPGLTKRALVLEAVKFAVAQGVSPDQLPAVIPPSKWLSLDGEIKSHEFWSRLEQSTGNQYSPKRYFGGDDDLFRIQGRTWVLSNQWSIDNMSIVDEIARRFSLRIKYGRASD